MKTRHKLFFPPRCSTPHLPPNNKMKSMENLFLFSCLLPTYHETSGRILSRLPTSNFRSFSTSLLIDFLAAAPSISRIFIQHLLPPVPERLSLPIFHYMSACMQVYAHKPHVMCADMHACRHMNSQVHPCMWCAYTHM